MTTPVTTPLPTTGTLNASQLAAVWNGALTRAGYSLPKQGGSAGSGPSVVIAVPIALAESGGKIAAVNHNKNGSTDYGLWQINSIHGYDPQRLVSDPNYNADAAVAIWKSAGGKWTPWSTYTSGAYKKFAGGNITDPGTEWDINVPGIGNVDENDVTGALGDITGPFAAIGKVFGYLGNAGFWLKVGLAILGVTAGIIGLVLLLKDTSVGKTAAKAGEAAAFL